MHKQRVSNQSLSAIFKSATTNQLKEVIIIRRNNIENNQASSTPPFSVSHTIKSPLPSIHTFRLGFLLPLLGSILTIPTPVIFTIKHVQEKQKGAFKKEERRRTG